MSPSLLWLIAGAVFLALEAFGVPGIGFLFAGVAAFFVGLMIETGMLEATNYSWQIAAFFINSTFLAALFWKKLKAWHSAREGKGYSNMVGDEASVIGTLAPGKEGQVRWSGTIMRAKLAGGEALTEGTIVVIEAVEGNLLTVRAK